MPQKSALERDLSDRALGIAQWVRAKDRGVLLAMALCLAPFPPVFLVGMALSFMNLRLARFGKIDAQDRPVIYTGFFVSAIYIVAWITLVWGLLHYGQLQAFSVFLRRIINWLFGWPLFQHGPPDSYLKRV